MTRFVMFTALCLGLFSGPASFPAGLQQPDDIPRLIRELEDRRVEVQLKAVEGLVSIGRPAVRALITVLDEQRAPNLRFYAIRALEQIGPEAEAAIPSLRAALSDKDQQVQMAATQALMRLGPTARDAVPALVDVLKGDPEPRVQELAAIAIGQVGLPTREVIHALVDALASKHAPSVQRAAALVLGGFGQAAEEALPALILAAKATDVEVQRQVYIALVQIRSPTGRTSAAVEAVLITGLKNDDATIREWASMGMTISPTRSGQSVKALIAALTDTYPRVAQNVAFALARIGPPAKEAVLALTYTLGHEHPVVRANSAEALGKIGMAPKETLDALRAAVQDTVIIVRGAAAEALGSVGAKARDVVPPLCAAMKVGEDSRVKEAIASSLASIAESTVQQGDTTSIDLLKESLATVRGSDAENSDNAIRRISGSINALEVMARFRGVDEFLKHSARNPWLIGAAVVIVAYLLWFVILRYAVLTRWPLRVLDWNEHLKPFVDFELPAWLGKLKIPTRHVLLIGVFHHHRLVLNAWVERYIEKARRNFKHSGTYRARDVYVPIPIELDGAPIPEPSAEALRAVSSRDRWSLLIWGEGGSGKTTLAYQIALWAMGGDSVSPLCLDRRMLPVVIEPLLEFDVRRDIDGFKKAIRGQLQDLVERAEPIPEDLFDRLLETRHILVILDGLSEMVTDPSGPERERARPAHHAFNAAALVVTSRTSELMTGTQAALHPSRIDSEHLSRFMNAYLARAGCVDIKDSELFHAYGRLAEMVSDGGHITPLLAKLYAEQMIASSRNGTPALDLPDTIPDLMLSYLNTLNRNRTDDDPDNPTIHRVAKVAASACLEQTFRPGSTARKGIIDALQDMPSAAAMLAYVEHRLRVIRSVPPDETHVQFELDPLAEYLAGMHAVEKHRGSKRAWERFLEKADRMAGAPESIRGFLLAVRDCCLVSKNDVPDTVVEGLGSRAGLDPDLIQRLRIKQRVQLHASNLGLDDAYDRQHAASSLGRIGPGAREAAPRLVELLRDPSMEVRRAAAAALCRIGHVGSGVGDELVKLLQDPDSDTQRLAVSVLNGIGPVGKEVIDELVALLQNTNADTRRNACSVLGGIGPPAQDAIPGLVKLLNDTDADIRQKACSALGRMGPPAKDAVPSLVRLLRESSTLVQGAAATALGLIGTPTKEALTELVESLTHSERSVREAATRVLSRFGPAAERAVPDLVTLLSEPNWSVRQAAVSVLGAIGPSATAVMPQLVRLLRDPHTAVRHSAGDALPRIGPLPREAVSDVVELLRDHDKAVRRVAISSLSRGGSATNQIVSELVTLLRDPEPNVRRLATWVLSNLGPKAEEAVPSLTWLLRDSNSAVRAAAAIALGRIGPAAKHVVPELLMLLDEPATYVRWAAAKAVDRIGTAAAQQADDEAQAPKK